MQTRGSDQCSIPNSQFSSEVDGRFSFRMRIENWKLSIGQIPGLIQNRGCCQVILARALISGPWRGFWIVMGARLDQGWLGVERVWPPRIGCLPSHQGSSGQGSPSLFGRENEEKSVERTIRQIAASRDSKRRCGCALTELLTPWTNYVPQSGDN